MTDSGRIFFNSNSLRCDCSCPCQYCSALSCARIRAVRFLPLKGLDMKSLAPASRLCTMVSAPSIPLTMMMGSAAPGYRRRISLTTVQPSAPGRDISSSTMVGKASKEPCPLRCRSSRTSRQSSAEKADTMLMSSLARSFFTTRWWMRSSSTASISMVEVATRTKAASALPDPGRGTAPTLPAWLGGGNGHGSTIRRERLRVLRS
mmetsp:Transcript_23058/g.64044  ORF Transcript_23058/g.64044 Transcript_23058/m.64044 type:complete len:205 (+) Transcript_23058:1181-1795(+)